MIAILSSLLMDQNNIINWKQIAGSSTRCSSWPNIVYVFAIRVGCMFDETGLRGGGIIWERSRVDVVSTRCNT